MKSTFYAVFLRVYNSTRYFTMFVFFTVAMHQKTAAQNFRLVKDINTATDGNPNNLGSRNQNGFAVLNGVNYFAANDGINGIGLWRSDGTTAGTYQVKAGINPSNIITVNNQLIFAGTGNPGLWKSDGTAAGTLPVLNVVPPGLSSFTPTNLTNMNGTVFFTLYFNNSQLWKSNGTANGTSLVKDLLAITNTGTEGYGIKGIIAIKNKIYFSAGEEINYRYTNVPWVSNGTAEGTLKLSGSIFNPARFTARSTDATDSLVYFTANESLYVTNGLPSMVGIAPGFNGIISDNYNNSELIKIGSVIYFIGRDNYNTQNQSLYKFDINAANGIQPVKMVIGTGLSGFPSSASNLYYQNGNLLFTVHDAVNNKVQLWKSNGTSLSNVLLKDSLIAYNFFNANGVSYFSGDGELWKTDGTANGTTLVKDIIPGYKSSNPIVSAAIGNTVLFAATSLESGNELWQSDGTSAGTTLLKDINQTSTSSSNPYYLLSLNDKLVFSGGNNNRTFRDNLYVSDGSSSGTNLINDTVSKVTSVSVVIDKILYFWGYSTGGIQGLYKSNGTSAGTTLVKSFYGISVNLNGMFKAGNLVYFYMFNRSTFTQELWRSDGTSANTYIIKNGSLSSNKNTFCELDNTLYFSVPNGGGLWKTDGTVDGTVLVKSSTYDVDNLVAGNGVLFFKYYDGVNNNIWKSDGTTAGTLKVSDSVTNAAPLIFSGNNLFFTGTGNIAAYGNRGIELYKTDGTSKGTFLVKDIVPGSGSSSVQLPILVNGIIFFVNYRSNGVELWKSNGTDSGTTFIYNFGNMAPSNTISCNGKIYFFINSSYQPDASRILWESDGTTTGTHITNDSVISNLKFDFDASLTAVGNQLFFTASSYQFGKELYVGDISGPPANDSFSLCPNGSAGITSNLVGTNYQWQIKSDTSVAFTNLTENNIFTGVTTSTLQVKNIPSSYAGAKFRCQVNGNTFSKTTTLTFAVNWTGNIDNSWKNTGNWGCGGLLPDANTNVVINYGQVIVNTNATCRTIYVKPGASVVVNTGFILNVIGK